MTITENFKRLVVASNIFKTVVFIFDTGGIIENPDSQLPRDVD